MSGIIVVEYAAIILVASTAHIAKVQPWMGFQKYGYHH
jgi:hypothetical protein